MLVKIFEVGGGTFGVEIDQAKLGVPKGRTAVGPAPRARRKCLLLLGRAQLQTPVSVVLINATSC
jgi:hypothetical protein